MSKFCDRAFLSLLTLVSFFLEASFSHLTHASEPICHLRLADGREINVVKMCGRKIPEQTNGRSPIRPTLTPNALTNDEDEDDGEDSGAIPRARTRLRSSIPTSTPASTTTAPTFPIQGIPPAKTGAPGSFPSGTTPTQLPPSSAPATRSPAIEQNGRDD